MKKISNTVMSLQAKSVSHTEGLSIYDHLKLMLACTWDTLRNTISTRATNTTDSHPHPPFIIAFTVIIFISYWHSHKKIK